MKVFRLYRRYTGLDNAIALLYEESGRLELAGNTQQAAMVLATALRTAPDDDVRVILDPPGYIHRLKSDEPAARCEQLNEEEKLAIWDEIREISSSFFHIRR